MWSDAEGRAVLRVLGELADRYEVEEWLGRCYGLRGVERADGVEYSGPDVGGWVRVRYLDDRLVAAVLVR